MMSYTIEQQFSRDIDWYFKDIKSNLIHVASGGGVFPKIISENDFLIESLHSQIIELPFQYEYIINPLLEQVVSFENEEFRKLYLEDFIDMAKRGFISVDKSKLGNYEDTYYHIVAYPVETDLVGLSFNFSVEFITSTKQFLKNDLSFDLFNYFDK